MIWAGLLLFGALFGFSGAWIVSKKAQKDKNKDIKAKLAKAEGIIKQLREQME